LILGVTGKVGQHLPVQALAAAPGRRVLESQELH
jgi:hypothetical protein